jgi:hypothetical protein
MESITLPSRLRARNGIRQTLDDIAASLNVNGNQNIAKLRMSVQAAAEAKTQVSDNSGASYLNSNTTDISQSRDQRLPSYLRATGHVSNGGSDDNETALEVLDIDFFPPEEQTYARGHRPRATPHVFGQTENWRDSKEEDFKSFEEGEEEGFDRARRRAAGLPVVHR